MPKIVYGYDSDGELHRFESRSLPPGYYKQDPTAVTKPDEDGEEPVRRRGRPPGSKNKPKEVTDNDID